MDLLDLRARLELDTDEYEAGMRAASRLADETAAHLEAAGERALGRMTGAMDAMVAGFNRRDEAKRGALATAQGVAEGLTAGLGAIGAAADAIGARLSSLASSAFASSAFASPAAASSAAVSSALSASASPASSSAFASSARRASGGPSASNADGLSYVPYNDYLSYLHKGEAVLTAAQAEDWRASRASSAPAPIDYAALGRAVAQAITGLSVQMDGQTVGHIVAPTVSADIAEGSRATRRYAVV